MQMNWVQRLIHAATTRNASPTSGAILRRRAEDAWRDYPADGLTPQKLVALFRRADAGDLAAQLALFEQMEEKDAHLYSVATTRRLAVTGLPWEIISAAQWPAGPIAGDGPGGDAELRARADDAAAYCNTVLRHLHGFEESLQHLSLAIGRNIALAELVWDAGGDGVELMEIVPVDFSRLILDDFDHVRLLTEDSPHDGIALPPDKFIVHTPHTTLGHPARGGLLRASALAFLGKHFALKDWLIFAEIFGMPVRIARYAPSATPEEKRELLEMLKHLGADATGIFSKAVEVEIIQSRSPGEVNLYENLCLYLDREVSKAWLGQTLTTDTARMLASAGAAKVHDQVRRDLRDNDLRTEAHTLRRDLLAPLARFRFGPDVPVPYFRRVVDPRHDPEALGRILDVAVNELGVRVPVAWAHAALGIPHAGPDDAALPGRRNAEHES
jgi:phage gp29-like protein